MIRVFIVDDFEIVLLGLRSLLEAEEDVEIVGEASTMENALALAPVSRPDVAILDVHLADGNGIELCRELRSSMPDLKCIMLTSFDDDKALMSAALAGASAYLVKTIRGFDLASAVRDVSAGKSLLGLEKARKLIAQHQENQDQRTKWLTAQEHKILGMIVEGKMNREIASELSLKEKTVKNYVSALLLKMGFSHRTEAAVYAAKLAERRKRRQLEESLVGSG